MSIRTKITLLVLVVGLSEAILLGVIGYNSVATVSRNAAELRRIGSAIEGARALSVSLSSLSDPGRLLSDDGGARKQFASEIGAIERRVAGCSATSCHGYEKRPPAMAAQVLQDLRAIRARGLEILSARSPGDPPPLAAWTEGVDSPTRRLSRTTGEMSDTLMSKARELETASREAEGSALFLVTVMALFCVFVAVALCHPLARGIARPLEHLAEQTRRIAGGDFSLRAAETGSRETALLGRAFNLMRDDLARHRERLLAHQTELERTVEERVSDLRRKDEQLRRIEQLAGIGLVAGAVAHDLNNPLTNILLNAEALRDAPPGAHPERHLVDAIMSDARRCREIAAGIRVLGRETEIDRSPCSVGDALQEAVRILRFKWEPRRIAVRCETSPSAPACLCSPPRILQLFVNLIDNAVDASPDGAEVRVRLRTEPRGLVVEVEDGGPGIPPEHRESLFKPFFTTRSEGTGLGLAISRRIVEQHEGTIEFETRIEGETGGSGPEGHGTRVRVVLPPGGCAD